MTAVIWLRVRGQGYSVGTVCTRVNDVAIDRKMGTEYRSFYKSGAVDVVWEGVI
jgi:hypothetical protein